MVAILRWQLKACFLRHDTGMDDEKQYNMQTHGQPRDGEDQREWEAHLKGAKRFLRLTTQTSP
jgi:galactose-1-phosphate uridylyltransferase